MALVGETPNPRTISVTKGVPFAAGPAGEWLTAAVLELGRPPVYVTNAIKHDGDERSVARELRWLRPRGVVALGQIASRTLAAAKIDHVAIQHPQYARRFHYQSSYASVLGDAIQQSLGGAA